MICIECYLYLFTIAMMYHYDLNRMLLVFIHDSNGFLHLFMIIQWKRLIKKLI